MQPVETKEGFAPFRDYRTWYRITGDLGARKAPVVVLHGGPGAAHNYVDAYKLLANQGRGVIHYDQLGCGNSTLLPDKGADFWTPELFITELNNLIDTLGIRSRYHVLGQSWG
ncbi:MAG: alpha/beta fold hydrolase, partial [Hyphomicrobiales bacterium]